MKVGIVSFMHESNSFSQTVTNLKMFEILRGPEIPREWAEAHHEIGGMLKTLPQLGLYAEPLLTAWAMPAGPVEEQTYEVILGEILAAVGHAAVDGLLVSLHGAMVAQHVRDADGLMLERIRRLVGPDVPMVLTLDLHANVSHTMISNVTATTMYRSNPHLDQRERGEEAAQTMADILRRKISPVQALEKPPLLIPIFSQKTAEEPLAAVYRKLDELIAQPHIISASVALGFSYADVEEMGTAFLVVADRDEKLARREARELARFAWNLRHRFTATGMPVPEAIKAAGLAETTPVTLLDAGDNVGGGSPADGTIVFDAIQQARIPKALVILYDPEAVSRCVEAGVGQEISLQAGGKTDQLHGGPVSVTGRIRLIHDGRFAEHQPRHGGKLTYDQGRTAVLETVEEHTLVLTSRRMAPFSLQQLYSLGIDPRRKRILIAKGAIAPRAAYEPVSPCLLEVDSPGITSPNPARFEYRHRGRPLFPLEPNAKYD